MDRTTWRGYSTKEKLYVLSKKMHVLPFMQFINRKVLRHGVYQNKKTSWEDFSYIWEREIDKFSSVIPSNKKKIVFSGHILAFDKGVCAYLNQISESIYPCEMMMISHASGIRNSEAVNLVDFNYYTLPYTFSLGCYSKNVDLDIPVYVENLIDSKPYLIQHCKKVEERHKDMGRNYAKGLVYWLYIYYIYFLNHFNPELVILWCEFFAGHSFLQEICDEKKIKVVYMEFGSIPGTFAIEEGGQMGESLVSINYEDFMQKEINEKELENAKEVLAYLKESKLNRRTQIKTDILERFKEHYIPNRPIVVYFGQNDYESGIKPYTEKSRKYHSPFFTDSDDAGLYLEKLCKKNHWNYIYKPHQMMVRVGECLDSRYSSSTTWVGDSDINELIDVADLCVTIVSQCAYISLIREKPVLMLGYSQLRGKKCTYEIEEKNQTERVAKEALLYGYTETQKRAFLKHVTQMLKYSLFNDLTCHIDYGQPISYACNLISDWLKRENKEGESFNERSVLFVCRNDYQIQFMKGVVSRLNKSVAVDLIVVVNKSFNGVLSAERFRNMIEIEDIGDISLTDLGDDRYSDLFIFEYDETIMHFYKSLCTFNTIDIRIHILDDAKYTSYVRDIPREKTTECDSDEKKLFYKNISELSFIDRSIVQNIDRIDFPITVMPKWTNIAGKVIRGNIFVFYEGDFLSKHFFLNILEVINKIKKMTGDLVIIRCDESEIDIYEREGFITIGSFEELYGNNCAESRYIVFSPFICEVFYNYIRSTCNLFFDMSFLMETNSTLLQSNSYKAMLKKLEKRDYCNYYVPRTFEEINVILEYEGVV